MEHNAKNIFNTVIRDQGKRTNLNKQMAELGISYFFNDIRTFCKIQYFSKVLKTDFTI